MSSAGSFLIEDFIDAITLQLDRVQDALRLKSVNRPLTYALKDLTLELQVFVEVDAAGNVRFRSSGPNEAGASTVHLGFTTITKPMIEENTISLAATRSPSLEQAGFNPDERRRMERLGVRTTGQLDQLKASTGLNTVARLSSMPIDRLRAALQMGRPHLDSIESANSTSAHGPAFGTNRSGLPVIQIARGNGVLHLSGANLVGQHGPPEVRLNDTPLKLLEAEDHRIIAKVPDEAQSGTLEVVLGGGESLRYHLQMEEGHKPESHSATISNGRWRADPWEAAEGRER